MPLLDVLRDHGMGKLSFPSTCLTYGVPVVMRIREDHPHYSGQHMRRV